MAYIGKQPGTGVRNRFLYTATAGQTTFTTSDSNLALSYSDALYMDVYLNGVLLDPANDYTATSGTSVVLGSGATAGDILEIVVYDVFSVFNNTIDGNFNVAGNTTLDNNLTVGGDLTVDTDTLVVDSTNNQVGIGTSPASDYTMHTHNAGNTFVYNKFTNSTTGNGGGANGLDVGISGVNALIYNYESGNIQFATDATERMRINSSGNLLVGATSTSTSTVGHTLFGDGSVNGIARHIADGVEALQIGRNTSDGSLAKFYKGGTTVASIDVSSNDNISFSARTGGGAGLQFFGAGGTKPTILPMKENSATDDETDLGRGANRFDNIFATNGTISTSDQNEKQQIANLTNAEITAAKALSKLFKTFKWNDKVEAKGDAARTHTGVIAQEVQQAMTDAGLDATKYAFWCSDTWWETQTEVPAVEADEENGIEAQDAYTRTDTYETAEEAPEGATERTRLGIRYPELLAFIGAATEQRLADIETRLTALEAE